MGFCYQKQSKIGGRCRVYNITKYGREYLEDNPIEINYNVMNNAAETVRAVRQAVMDFGGETSHEADIAIAVLEYTPESAERHTL